MTLQLSLGITPNPRTLPVIEGRVKPESIEFLPTVLHPSELFWRQLALRRVRRVGDVDLVADDREVEGRRPLRRHPGLHHAAFFHTTHAGPRDAGIDKPADLKGKRVGVPEYQQTAALWSRGVLQHEFGVEPKDMEFWMERPPSTQPRRRDRLQAAAGRHRQPDSAGEEHRFDDGVGRARRGDLLSARSQPGRPQHHRPAQPSRHQAAVPGSAGPRASGTTARPGSIRSTTAW